MGWTILPLFGVANRISQDQAEFFSIAYLVNDRHTFHEVRGDSTVRPQVNEEAKKKRNFAKAGCLFKLSSYCVR
jgi:hypothetical protein